MEQKDELRWLFVEASREALEGWVQEMESRMEGIELACPPKKMLCMAVAEESLENQRFCLGEVLCTECEVLYQGHRFLGRSIGEEPLRALATAFLEAALAEAPAILQEMRGSLDAEKARIREMAEKASKALGSTRVRFETMRPT